MSDVQRPLVTFVLFTYNQEVYVRQAVEAALAQTYSPLELLISDDGSSDGTASIVRSAIADYTGPHKIIFNVNAMNIGMANHVNKAFALAHGKLLIFAAGDDVSAPMRTERIVARWVAKACQPSALYSAAHTIDSGGHQKGALVTALSTMNPSAENLIGYDHPWRLLLMGACAAYAPGIYRHFGELMPDLTVEDIPLTVRASMLGGVEFIDEPLVNYRINVSVWLPRKIINEGFDRHLKRMLHRIHANHLVSKQILADTFKRGDARIINVAHHRYAASTFSLNVCENHRFSLMRYLRNSMTSGHWRSSLFPAILFAFPRLHRWLFILKSRFGRGKA